ncbi:MAG: hypothetical protein WAL48_13155 [Xanthobacteraceae bacterium]
MHELRNGVLNQPTDVDADRVFVEVGLLQDCELAVEEARRHKMLFAGGQARGNHRPVGVQVDDAHLRSPTGQEVAIAAPERRAGDDAGRAGLPPGVDPVCDLLQPGPPVAVIERMAGMHLGDVRRRMELVAFLERPVELLGEGCRDRRFPAA